MTDALWNLIGASGRGALVALKRDGRPQLSNVDYLREGDLIRISSTADRAKVRNLRRDPRASLYVSTADGGWYAVAEGVVELSAVAAEPGDAAVEELIEVYRGIRGEHPDWADYRHAMVADQRLVIRLHVTRRYGMAP
ncbi:PPOX class F420-dependent oxidoreductase [Catellatospora tritici]|uniref:PPOX class F420-dependent oxidoreductase n=1 Tax=Catellatospora tritici TaxID=2851566 RepID=UPI001C2CE861|nr:PPOX class F420-dependent oxidoreductase [Catellatospora tritici]MBV1850269.1 PPOX class F420-dependent oxidoreductase [Catellatospora tritici]